MFFHSRPVRWIAAVLLLCCLLGLERMHEYMSKRRGELRVAQPWEPYAAGGDERVKTDRLDVPLEEMTGIIFGGLIAGFRHQAANITYWRMQQYWEDGKWHRVLGMLKLTCFLDPHFKDAWTMLGWHQAYNMAAEAEIKPEEKRTPQDKSPEFYIAAGLKSYEEGLKYNPGAHILYENAGWTAFDKAGELELASEYIQKALFTWDPDPDVTKQGPRMYRRMLGHAYEKMPDMPRALASYRDLLRYDWADSVGIGATYTIRERYVPALRLLERGGDPQEAIDMLAEVFHRRPTDPLLHGLLAGIYEHDLGDKEAALAAWELGAQGWRNKIARIQALRLTRELGRERDLRGLNYDDQLDAKRFYKDIVWGLHADGMGVLLNVRRGPTPGTYTDGRQVDMDEVIRIDPSTGVAALGSGTARWYLNGVLMEPTDTDREPPHTFQLDLAPFSESGAEAFLIKVEFKPDGGSRTLWDVASLRMPWTVPQPEMPTEGTAAAIPPMPDSGGSAPVPPAPIPPAPDDEHAGHDH